MVKTEPSHDPAIALLGVHPKKWNAGSQRDVFISMLLTPLFTVTKRKKQQKCPPPDEWLNKIRFTGTLLSVRKKEENSITSYSMDEP